MAKEKVRNRQRESYQLRERECVFSRNDWIRGLYLLSSWHSIPIGIL